MFTINYLRKNLRLDLTDEGFSLIELATVVTILGILSSVSITNINKWVKLAKADEAVSMLNNSLIECLQYSRNGTDPTTVSPPNGVISNDSLLSAQYKIKDGKNKCSDFFIEPINSDEKTLFEMGYQINASGNVTKIGTPADKESSLSRCKRWAGSNCGASEEQKAAWAAAAALAKEKKDCNDAFYTWLNDTPPNGGIGSYKRWNTEAKSCTLNTFAFEGTILSSQQAVDAAQAAKLGAICNNKVLEQKNNKINGITSLDECPGQTFYFCQGIDKQTEDAMNVCKADHQEDFCKSEITKAKQNGHTGKFAAPGGPGVCSQNYWFCGEYEYTKQADFDESTCAGSEDETEGDETKYSSGAKTYCLDQMDQEGIVNEIKSFCDNVKSSPGAYSTWWGCNKYQQCLDDNPKR